MGRKVVSLGGGLNSVAVLALMRQNGERPDAILFADTGAERPRTYRFIRGPLRDWLHVEGFPPVVEVWGRVKGYATLEAECYGESTLPSLAFGFRRCSDHWKIRPMDKWVRRWRRKGEVVTRVIGYDADESHRGKPDEGGGFCFEYPLVAADMGRDECAELLSGVDLDVPCKSACFFCPAAKKPEVVQFSRHEPDLFARAVAMERRAKSAGNLQTVRGLGRNWSWEALAQADEAQWDMWPDATDIPCACYDG